MALRRFDEVDAPVLTEAAVLGDDHGAREVGRDALDRHPLLVDRRAGHELQRHQHRERRIDEAEGDDEQQDRDEPAAENKHGDAHGAAEQIAQVAPRRGGLGAARGYGGRRLDIGGG